LVIHICWKVEREDKIDPPIQTEYFRSGGATTLTLIAGGAIWILIIHFIPFGLPSHS